MMDDEPLLRSVVSRVLGGAGHTVEAACDGAECVEMARAASARGRPFHLFLLDLTIPGGLGGREIVGELRAIEPGARIVATSGYDAAASEGAEEFDAFIPKPYVADALIARIAELLGELSSPSTEP